MTEVPDFAFATITRFTELLEAPLSDPRMLWAAIPLLLATIFMTLYFGKYRREELGWNTAFGNTMVFLFVSLNIVQYLYYLGSPEGTWQNILDNEFYFSVVTGLVGASFVLMLITYYHLLPKNVAFFLFSAAPVNVSVYVLMTIVYTGVPADETTLVAAVVLFLVIFAMLRGLQMLESVAGKSEGMFSEEDKEEKNKEEKKEEDKKFLKKLKKKNVELEKKRKD